MNIEILLDKGEGVVNGGTGHNAAVEGYRIGGKTGSSQTVYSDDYTIVSFLGFAPADDPQVIIPVTPAKASRKIGLKNKFAFPARIT